MGEQHRGVATVAVRNGCIKGLPVACTDVPRRPTSVLPRHASHRGDSRIDGTLRRRGLPQICRSVQGHPLATCADDVRSHVEARPRGACQVRRVND